MGVVKIYVHMSYYTIIKKDLKLPIKMIIFRISKIGFNPLETRLKPKCFTNSKTAMNRLFCGIITTLPMEIRQYRFFMKRANTFENFWKYL